uniref:Retrotransposon gag domain-containing protein n=1 Tax=Chenopodium quinoa TaxID=63459 RepID=A0A803N4L8_CHEQI
MEKSKDGKDASASQTTEGYASEAIIQAVQKLEKRVNKVDERSAKAEVAACDMTDFVSKVENEAFEKMMGEMVKMREEFRGELLAFKKENEFLNEELTLLRRAAVTGGATIQAGPKVEIPKPPKYHGKRDAREIDNFLWSMERYFEAVHLEEDASKINAATMYLGDDVILWWRRCELDIKNGSCSIQTWDQFKEDFKKQFRPHDAAKVFMMKLRELKHSSTIKEYIKQFTTLVLEVDDCRRLHNLYISLEGCNDELNKRTQGRMGVAMAAREKVGKPSPPIEAAPVATRRDCPGRQKLRAIIASGGESSGDDAQMGSLRFFSSVRATPKAEENTEVVKELVDCGASHNFITEKEAMKLGIKYTKEPNRIKIVYTLPVPILGVVHKVPICLGQWSGTINLTVVHMDDFSLVLGLEFIDTVRPFSFEGGGSIMIKRDQGAWSVPVTREHVEAKTISAIQVSRGIKKGQDTFLATLVKEEPHGGEVPSEISGVLEEYKDVMPPELPKRLPPKREHCPTTQSHSSYTLMPQTLLSEDFSCKKGIQWPMSHASLMTPRGDT